MQTHSGDTPPPFVILGGLLDAATLPLQIPYWLDEWDQKSKAADRAADWTVCRQKALERARAHPECLETESATYCCEGSRFGLAYGDPSISFTEKALVSQALQCIGGRRVDYGSRTADAEMVALLSRPEWTPRALDAVALQYFVNMRRPEYDWLHCDAEIPANVRSVFAGHSFAACEIAPSDAAKFIRSSFGACGGYEADWRIGGWWNTCVVGALKTPVPFSSDFYRGEILNAYACATPGVKSAVAANGAVDAGILRNERVGALLCSFPTVDDYHAFLRDLVPACLLSEPHCWEQVIYRPENGDSRCFAFCVEMQSSAGRRPFQVMIVDVTIPEVRFWIPENFFEKHVWFFDTNRVLPSF